MEQSNPATYECARPAPGAGLGFLDCVCVCVCVFFMHLWNGTKHLIILHGNLGLCCFISLASKRRLGRRRCWRNFNLIFSFVMNPHRYEREKKRRITDKRDSRSSFIWRHLRRHCNKINKAKSRPNQIEQHNLDIILDILILALAPPRIPTNFWGASGTWSSLWVESETEYEKCKPKNWIWKWKWMCCSGWCCAWCRGCWHKLNLIVQVVSQLVSLTVCLPGCLFVVCPCI